MNRFLRAFLVFATALAIVRPIAAQNVIEGSKGVSSLDYSQYGGGIISFNGADKKIELSYINYKFKRRPFQNGSSLNYSETPFWYGFSVSGKAVNDYATIFSKGKIYPSTEMKVKAGYRIFGDPRAFLNNSSTIDEQIKVLEIERQNPATVEGRKKDIDKKVNELVTSLSPPSELWLIGRAGYNVSRFYLFDPVRSFDDQFQLTRFDGFTGSVGLNYWNPDLFRMKTILLAGLTIGLRRQNNVDDLEEITADDVTVYSDPGANTTRSIKLTQVGFGGPYQTFNTIPVNFDLYFKPHHLTNAAFSFYGRMNSFNKINGVAYPGGRQYPVNLGVGVFLLNENWLANPAGGITFELKDAFKTLNAATTFKDRLVINFVTRVNILRYRD